MEEGFHVESIEDDDFEMGSAADKRDNKACPSGDKLETETTQIIKIMFMI